MSKVEKIKAEIERLKNDRKFILKLRCFPYAALILDKVLEHLLSFIDSLSDTEKDFGIKESVIPFGASDSELMEATYFIPQGYHAVIEGNKVIIKKGKEPVSNDLEDFSKKESESFAEREYEIDYIDRNALAKGYYWGVKAGAQWQKERILNNAIEREVKVDAGGYPYIDVTELYDYDKDKPLAKKGDKVKLIIIMEE